MVPPPHSAQGRQTVVRALVLELVEGPTRQGVGLRVGEGARPRSTHVDYDPSGQRFLVLDQTLEAGTQPQITLVQNWLAELARRVATTIDGP